MQVVQLLSAAIHQVSLRRRGAGEITEAAQAFKEIGVQTLGGFDLQGVQLAALIEEQVHLPPGMVPPKVGVGPQSAVVILLEHLGDDQVFEQRTAGIVCKQVLLRLDTQQGAGAGHACIPKVEFRGFDEPFTEVPVIRSKGKCLKTRLQNGQPAPGGFLVDARRIADFRLVEQLSDPTCTQLQKGLKGAQIGDVDNLPGVALQVNSLFSSNIRKSGIQFLNFSNSLSNWNSGYLHIHLCKNLCTMPTNLNIDPSLLEEALKVGGLSTKKETVNLALREFVLRRKQRAIVDLFGTIDFDPNYDYKQHRDK